jgi:signal transduction histidine kinase/ActR/RegA family two-component response regulator
MGLRTKFLLSLVVASAAITMASLWMVRGRVGAEFRERLDKSLQNSAATFKTIHQQRESYDQRTAEFISNDPVLKALMSLGDPATVQPEANGIRRRSGADLLVLAAPSGKVLAMDAADTTISRQAVDPLFQRSLAGPATRDWWFIEGHLFEVFLQPIYSAISEDDRIPRGVLALGHEIDSGLAQEAAGIAAGNAAFRYDGKIVVSTLTPAQIADLNRQGSDLSGSQQRELRLGGETFLMRLVTVNAGNSTPVELVMLQSYDEATRFLSSLNQLIVVVAVVAVILGTAFVFVISHTFTRPLAELVSGVRALGKGDFSYPLRTTGKDEVAELTATFDKMRQNLQESQSRMVNAARMEAVGQLAGGVAHDFNNLVTIIKGYTELLILKLPPSDPAAGYAEQIRKAGDRAASVTRQLLAFSRKQVLQPDVLDLNAIAIGMEKMLKVLIGEDIEIKITSEAGLRKVLADPGQIEQILLNLAVNARDAMPKGGKIGVVTTNVDVDPAAVKPAIGEAQQGPYVRLSFSDSGCGMSADTADKIFQPFFTTKESGKGTGLGLAIVCGIVKQSGGFITLSSELGRGTTFDIFLPETERSAAAVLPERVAASPVARGIETVLLVEDEDALRALGREALRMHGYNVLEAANGREAVEIFSAHAKSVNVVVSDVVMPLLSGVDLVEKLRARVPDLKVLFISGYTDRTDDIEQSGFRLLQKPFSPDQLVKAVTETLRNSARVRTATSSS